VLLPIEAEGQLATARDRYCFCLKAEAASDCGGSSRGYPGPVPDASHLVAFALAATTIALIPGPGTLYVLARSLGGGRTEGLRSTVGTGIGGMVHVAAAAAGLSAIIATSATAFTVVKYVGAAYLVWLGCQALFSRDHDAPSVAADGPAPASNALQQGVVTEVLNPKTALFPSPSCRSSASRRTGRWSCKC
jgi:hypothetical protein